MHKIFKLTFPLIVLFAASCQTLRTSDEKEIKNIEFKTIHGTLLVDDPLALEIISTEAFQRLKKIRQYGTTDYLYPLRIPYSRFTHTLGVYYILKKHDTSQKEQIAGLLHDISHTAFSHASDPLFMGDLNSGAYQDVIHVAFLKEHGIDHILRKYDITAEDMDLMKRPFPALKQKHPNLCADRIEYIIYAGHKEGTLSLDQIAIIHRSLKFDGESWYFTDKESAKLFSQISLVETLNYWGGPESLFNGFKTSDILSYALNKGYISKAELTYLAGDDELWQKLNMQNDPTLKNKIRELFNFEQFTSDLPENCRKRHYSKFRGVDPLIQIGEKRTRLSKVDKSYAKKYDEAFKAVKKGFCIPAL